MNDKYLKQCLRTYTNTPLDPLSPQPEDIKKEDIAHALSLMCRSNGHVPYFYSVAQHSLNCSNEARVRGYSARIELACLLHDASEAYIADIVRPIKHNQPNYLEIEHGLQNAIWIHFGLADLTERELSAVNEIDDRVLRYEFLELMKEDLNNGDSILASVPDLNLREFSAVEIDFLQRLAELTAEV
ncbi:MAG: phosphohydrolase [Oscillospiraceae bacterium]